MSKTKCRLAEALKKLVKTKSLKKITIQDIVDESGMTRQSFYYHFHDIYEIIEWMCKNDLLKNCEVREDNLDAWIYQLFINVIEEKRFYKKVIAEFGRELVEKTLEEEVYERIVQTFEAANISDKGIRSFLTVSLTNYLILIAQSSKDEVDQEQIEQITNFLVTTISEYQRAKKVVKYA